MVTEGCEVHDQFLTVVASDYQKSERICLEKVAEYLMPENDLSRYSAGSTEPISVSRSAKVGILEKSSCTAKNQQSTPLVFIQSKPRPPSEASKTKSLTHKFGKASSTSSNLHQEEEEEEEHKVLPNESLHSTERLRKKNLPSLGQREASAVSTSDRHFLLGTRSS